MDRKLRRDVIDRRVAKLTRLVDELLAQRAEERIGETVEVLIESIDAGVAEGRAEHQAPEVDGSTTVTGLAAAQVGDVVTARVSGSDGADLVAAALPDVVRPQVAG
jgi:tRNA A37 methylthiotransferase MiaB